MIPKSEGESIAAKFSCAFCETTAADDYEYVQQLFHRTVREVRKERERTVASNTIDEEVSTPAININAIFPSPSSSLSSNSSIQFPTSNEIEKTLSSNIPLPPPMPATLVHQAAEAAKTIKQPESQTTVASSPLSSSVKSTSTTTSLPTQPTSATPKRTPSKSSSVFSKIFK